MGLKRVVITGLGTINPLGNNISEYFANLDSGVSGSCLIDRFDTTNFKTKFACQVKDFNPTDYGISSKEIRRLDKFVQYALVASSEAIIDSKLNFDSENLKRIGVILGSGIGGIESLFHEIMDYSEGGNIPRFSPFLITKMIANVAPGYISMKYKLMGPNYTVTSACASSGHAITDAFEAIRYGKADVMLTGGTEAPICPPGIGSFVSAKAMSSNNENYKKASRPFDKNRDGFVMGEGSGILILEELDHALARGAKIYAEILGTGSTADAFHITAPHPDGEGAMSAITLALEDAHISGNDVDYINLHGTSTPKGDIAELKAIKSIFKDHAYELNLSSTKSMTGHLLGAAGAIEAQACIHAINSGIIPPTINFETEDPEIDYKMNLTLNKAQRRPVKIALNNAFGFGGHNSCVIFGAYK